jgi:hypothetical protein
MRYIHPSDADMDEAITKARNAQGGHSSGHTADIETKTQTGLGKAIN